MKTPALILLIVSAATLTACSSSPQPDTSGAPTITYTDLHSYGVDMGCKAALQNVGTPESGWQDAPDIKGTKSDYLEGWKQGFQKCRIGLGPVQLPVKQQTE